VGEDSRHYLDVVTRLPNGWPLVIGIFVFVAAAARVGGRTGHGLRSFSTPLRLAGAASTRPTWSRLFALARPSWTESKSSAKTRGTLRDQAGRSTTIDNSPVYSWRYLTTVSRSAMR
jgi:hypothetical protein